MIHTRTQEKWKTKVMQILREQTRSIMGNLQMVNVWENLKALTLTVADPDLQMRGGGRNGHPDPEIRRGTISKKKISAIRVSVWSKNKAGGTPRPLPWISQLYLMHERSHITRAVAAVYSCLALSGELKKRWRRRQRERKKSNRLD